MRIEIIATRAVAKVVEMGGAFGGHSGIHAVFAYLDARKGYNCAQREDLRHAVIDAFNSDNT